MGPDIHVVDPRDPTGFRRAHRMVRAHLADLHGDLLPNRLSERHAQVLVDLASTKRSLVTLATAADRDVGVAVLYPERDGSDLAVVYTDPAHRRRGVATALLRELGEAASAQGAFPVSATTDQHEPATALAASLGIYPLSVREPGRLRFELPTPHQLSDTTAARS